MVTHKGLVLENVGPAPRLCPAGEKSGIHEYASKNEAYEVGGIDGKI
jgi:hypothetical protein